MPLTLPCPLVPPPDNVCVCRGGSAGSGDADNICWYQGDQLCSSCNDGLELNGNQCSCPYGQHELGEYGDFEWDAGTGVTIQPDDILNNCTAESPCMLKNVATSQYLKGEGGGSLRTLNTADQNCIWHRMWYFEDTGDNDGYFFMASVQYNDNRRLGASADGSIWYNQPDYSGNADEAKWRLTAEGKLQNKAYPSQYLAALESDGNHFYSTGDGTVNAEWTVEGAPDSWSLHPYEYGVPDDIMCEGAWPACSRSATTTTTTTTTTTSTDHTCRA